MDTVALLAIVAGFGILLSFPARAVYARLAAVHRVAPGTTVRAAPGDEPQDMTVGTAFMLDYLGGDDDETVRVR